MTLLKSNVKRIFVLFLALCAFFSLVACGEDDKTIDPETQIREALGSINLGDMNALNQSFDLIKVTVKHDLEIEWTVVNVQGETAAIDNTREVPRVIITPQPYEEDGEGNQINERGQATLRATVRIGDKSSFREWGLWIVRMSKGLDMPIKDVLAQENNTVVGFTGTVLFVHGNGFYVADETGSIYVYAKPENSNVLPGAVVSIEGTKIIAFGQPEIDGKGVKINLITNTPSTGFDYQSLAVDAYVPEIAWQPATNYEAYGKIVNLSGKVTKSQYKEYENLEITDELTGEKVMIYHDSDEDFIAAVEANVDKYVKLTAITLSFHSTDKVWRILGYSGSVEEIDAPVYATKEKLKLVGIKLETQFKGKKVVEDLVLPIDSIFDSTVSWESKNTTVIGNDGKFTTPTEDTEVELIASVTLGDDTEDFTFKVLAKAQTSGSGDRDLFFSEYGEGSSSNKWLEIYNPTDNAIDLSSFKIKLFSNGASTPSQTLELSGPLAAAGVYVICNSKANNTIKDSSNLENSMVINFNGNDAVGLYKDDMLIDLIGVIGTDPGSSWPVGSGSTVDHTLVRKASVVGPNTVFTTDEWDVFPKDTFDYIGSHPHS